MKVPEQAFKTAERRPETISPIEADLLINGSR
jgi:hypothetical protein